MPRTVKLDPPPQPSLRSVCVYCGSSETAPAAWRSAAAELGRQLAAEGLRLVYGGGGVGLMGEIARAVRAAGGEVLGVIPGFLIPAEMAAPDTQVVVSMHERKLAMFEAADAFVVLPGAIGTLEEAVELLSWRRLGLHAKPIVFYDPDGFWQPLFSLFDRFIATGMLPGEFARCWARIDRIDEVLPAIRAMPADVLLSIPVIQRLV
jgi:uncharacterized protein (TIGR00730 family)